MKYCFIPVLAGSALLSACAFVDGTGGRYFNVDVPAESFRTPHKPHVVFRGLIRTVDGQCLDIDQSNTNRKLITYRCHGQSNQQFVFDGRLIVVNGMCLDVAGENRNPGAEVIAYSCHGRANQIWHYDGRNIRNAMNGFCLDAGKTGNRVSMQRCDGSPGQLFMR